jgi:hypothetical protein
MNLFVSSSLKKGIQYICETLLLLEDLCAFMLSRSIRLRMRNAETKFLQKTKTRILGSKISENRAVCEIMWKNVVEPERPQTTIQ